MPQYGTWTPYAGREAMVLALLLLVIAGALAFFALRLRKALQPRTTGAFAGGLLSALWLLSWAMFFVNAGVYYLAFVRAVGNFAGPDSPIAPVTNVAELLGFIAILVLSRRSGWKTALGSAILGMLAAPMVFELPFDLIVMGRIYPAPPAPIALYTLLFFQPLYLVSLSSFGLLTLSPLVRLSRYTLWCLAAMFLVFAVWALLGFSYPSSPIPFALNAISKILAFAAVVMLFLPQHAAVARPGSELAGGGQPGWA